MYHENQAKQFNKIMKRQFRKATKKHKEQPQFENVYMREAVLALIHSQNPQVLAGKRGGNSRKIT